MPTRISIGVILLLALAVEIVLPANEAVAGPFGRRCGSRRVVRLPTCHARAEGATLRPSLDDGVVFYTLADTTTELVMKVMGQEIWQTQGQTYAVQWNARGRNTEGNWILDAKILAIKMRIDIGGITIEYDSEKRPSPSWAGHFFTILQQPYHRFIVQRDGTVIRIEALDQLLKQFVNSNPEMRLLGKSITMQMNNLAEPFLDFSPSCTVFPSDSWKKNRIRDFGPIGTYREELVFTYLGNAGGMQRIDVIGKLTHEPARAAANQDLPFVIKSANLKGPQSQVVFFDPCRRRLKERTGVSHLAGDLVIEIGGSRTYVTLQQTQRQRIVISDTDPFLGDFVSRGAGYRE